MNDKRTFDVVVVGAGFAGLAAALEANKRGASVIVLGDRGQLANNSAMSGGMFAMAGTPMQKEQGINDSPELFMQDIMTASHNTADPEFVRIATLASREMYDWLVGLGASFARIAPQTGHSVLRVHQETGDRDTTAGRGGRLVKLMHETLKSRGVEIRLNTPVTHVLKDIRGRAVGVKAGDTEFEARQGVILAAGGFAKNPEMLKKYAPEVVGMRTNSAAGSTGVGITVAIEAGAAVVNMDTVLMTCAVRMTGPIPDVMAAGLRLGLTEGIAISKTGRRFMDESLSAYATAEKLMSQPERMAFAVFDAETTAKAGLDKDTRLVRGASPQELATRLGIDGKTLDKTVTEYNAKVPTIDAYGHPLQKRPLRGMLSAIPFSGMIIMTYGGVKTNTRMQALDKDGRAIPGLFAAGDNATGLCGPSEGHNGVPGYLTGCGNLMALVSGRIAGVNAAGSH